MATQKSARDAKNPQQPPSPVNATYVEPSAERILKPGTKIGDLLRRNMTQPYVLQRLADRHGWVQASNYGTVFHLGQRNQDNANPRTRG